MARRKGSGLGVKWYLPGGKRPIGETTMATSNLLRYLAEDGLTFAEAEREMVYDTEGRAVMRAFIDNGYGDTPMRDAGVR